MGEYDIPAFVDRILEVTKKPKVTLIGYSQGSTQIYYGLAKKQDYFAERVNRFIGLASCAYVYQKYSYERTVKEQWYNMKRGFYNINGGDESSINDGGKDSVSLKAGLHYA